MSTVTALRERTFSETVAANVRGMAASAGYSQSSLGRALGMSQTQTHKRWHGVIPWSLDELAELSELLGVRVSTLIDGFIPDMQNPARWIAPSGAAARSKGLEPPTF
ncbi:helix-turn-helix transcriptional regulator [Schaalia sp. ZJ1691]|uniref:helix-turn-helix domain-containing protein n=1 Tax=Schaalia sp. ZJ1691 TaxID=2709404 RepID=UPI0013ED1546|nr:helix-turn-helix transcriptional regulator [Schaalia sp. ZJ1691]